MQCKFDDKGTIFVDWNRQRQLLLSLLRVLQNLLSPQCANSINFHNTWTGEDVLSQGSRLEDRKLLSNT